MEKNLNDLAFPVNKKTGYSKHEHTTITFIAALLSNPYTRSDTEEEREAIAIKAQALATFVLNAF